jgi:4-alpha-glucanotransferase
MRISFKIDYQVLPGQRIYIAGANDRLGGWNAKKALPMKKISEGEWEAEFDIDGLDYLEYKYIIKDKEKRVIWEWGANRMLLLKGRDFDEVRVRDFWHSSDDAENVLLSSAFTKVLMARDSEKVKKVEERRGMVLRFQVQVPRISSNYRLCVSGNQEVLGNWDEAKAVVMSDADFPLWAVEVDAAKVEFPIEFKYGIYDTEKKYIVTWEEGNNRVIRDFVCESPKSIKVHTDQKFRYPVGHWKAAGVSVPVSALRTAESRGIGEFNDIKKLVDWCKKTGLKLIQIFSVNEAETVNSGIESYPFKEISSIALHPVYINVESVGMIGDQSSFNEFQIAIDKISSVDVVRFDEIYKIKLKYLKGVFESHKDEFAEDAGFIEFFSANREWLLPYAAFCYYRDKYDTSNFREWERYSEYANVEVNSVCSPGGELYSDCAFYFFIQYHLHKQLLDVSDYARKSGVVLKGAIPVGISANSVDGWIYPGLFKTDQQMGVYPDEFTEEGQNLEIPAFDWEVMASTGYDWWKKRFAKMAEYFDAYRIDNISGLIRSWEISDDYVQDVMGHFNPALPLTRDELMNYGIFFDEERFATPFIRDYFLWELFGEFTDEVKTHFLTEYALREYRLKPEFDTQKKIYDYFGKKEKELSSREIQICDGLISLIGEVIFLQDSYDRKKFHPRLFFTGTESFINFEESVRHNLEQVYIDFFYKRHEDFWCEQAMKRVPEIVYSTDMLSCGDDLGRVPGCVPGILKELGVLSLEVQRVSKDPDIEFEHLADTPYLSVCSTSTYDMCSLKEWWREDAARSQRFYETVLGHQTELSEKLEPRIAREIISQHLWSPSMWSVFPLHDLLPLGSNLDDDVEVSREFRLGFSLEELLGEDEFNRKLSELISSSGRDVDY